MADKMTDDFFADYITRADEILEQKELERNKAIPNHVFSKKYERNIAKMIKKKSKTTKQIKIVTKLRYVTVALFITLSVNGILFVTVEAYREKVIEIVTSVYETFTSVKISTDDSSLNDKPIFVEPTYIPIGFEVISSDEYEYDIIVRYSDENNKIYTYRQMVISNSETKYDTEGAKISEIEINGNTINLIENKDFVIAYWYDDTYSYAIDGEISLNEMMKIVESIQT